MRKREGLFRTEMRVKLFGGDPVRLLNACAEAGLALRDIACDAQGGMTLTLAEEEYARFEKIALLCMCELGDVSLCASSEGRRMVKARSRLGLIFALFALLLSASSLFIWNIEVVGNERLTKGEILRALEDCGFAEGCYWPGSDAEELRGQMLSRLDELVWMTVNVRGSRATVLVLEREEQPEIYDEKSPADLIAACDGLITDYSVKNGQTKIARGQIVTKGELLVSGSMESLTGAPRLVRAEGSVSADTWRQTTIFLEPGARQKEEKNGCFVIASVQMGKERIKLPSKSRKELDECDKIVKEYHLGIEGLFHIPIRLVIEIYRPYGLREQVSLNFDAAEERALTSLREEIDGEIIEFSFDENEESLTLYAHCLENIALQREITE